MTAFAVASTNATLYVTPSSTYPIRIARVEANLAYSSGGSASYSISKYTGSTISGGSAYTPVPMRDGSTAPTATAKTDATISGGSSIQLHAESGALGSNTSGQSATINSQYDFPFDVILKSGSVLWVTVSGGTAVIYFEEIREDWPT